jgi:hypothetical protein
MFEPLGTFDDADGHQLHGKNTHRLDVPAATSWLASPDR